MPTTFESAVVFLLFIVPGFLLLRGYRRARTHAAPATNLAELAQAVVASVFVIAVGWRLGLDDVFKWANEGTLGKHEPEVYRRVLLTLALPFPIGFVASQVGRAIEGFLESDESWMYRFVKPPVIRKAVEQIGLFTGPTGWDQSWSRVIGRGRRFYAHIGLKDGGVVAGAFGDESRIGKSPLPHEVYLEREYSYDEDGTLRPVKNTKGVYVDGGQVAWVRFQGIDQ